MNGITIGEYLSKRLASVKIKDFFAVPGDYNLVLLDELIKNWRFPMPSYLKIDVDGIENIIIKNSTFLLKNAELESVLIEINRNRDEDTEIISILESMGFKYDKDQVEDATRKSGSHKGYAEFLFYK